jgi:hypothetical protein
MLEIKQLENQAQKLLARLGTEAYIRFTERDQLTLDREDVAIRTLLTELSMLKEAIEKKEAELRDRKQP